MKKSNLKNLIRNIIKEAVIQKTKDQNHEFDDGRSSVMRAVNVGEDKEKQKPKLIDTGFYQISEKQAKELCGGTLPKAGYEKLVRAPDNFETSRGFVWVAITITGSKPVWSIRDSEYHILKNGFISNPTQQDKKTNDITDMESQPSGKELDEISGTGAAGGYQIPAWGTKHKDGSKKALDVTQRMGYKKVKSISERRK